MTEALAPYQPISIRPQADGDARLIELWLYGRSPRTRWAYGADAARFRAFTGRPLAQVGLGEPQA